MLQARVIPMPYVQTLLVPTSVLVTRVSLVMDSPVEVLMFFSAVIHCFGYLLLRIDILIVLYEI